MQLEELEDISFIKYDRKVAELVLDSIIYSPELEELHEILTELTRRSLLLTYDN